MYSVQSESLALAHSEQWKSNCKSSVEFAGTSPLGIVEANMQENSVSIEVREFVKNLGKAALVELLTKETMLMVTIKTLEDFCNTEAPSLEKLERMSIKLEDSLSSYEDAYIAYQSAEVADLAAEAQTVSKEEQSRSGNPEMKQESAACCNYQKLKQESSIKEEKVCIEAEVKLAAHTIKAEAVESRLPRLGKVESNTMIDNEVENSASNQLMEEEKESEKENSLKADTLLPPDRMEKKTKAGKLWNFAEAAELPGFKESMLRQHNLNTKEVEKHADAKQLNYNLKVETEDRMQSAGEQAVQLKKVKQRLKEEKVSRYAMDWHELSPLIADKLVPPDREVEEIGAKDRLDEVEKDWQGSVPLVIDKQGQVEMSVSKKVVMKLLNTKAEAEQKRKSKMKLMEEMLLELLKQYIELKACEEEEHEALPLLIDKQAAAG